MNNQFSPSDEYKILRAELSDGKKYIFERPLFIITLSIAGFNLIETSFVAALLPIAVGLLLFNLWFTINRARSMGRSFHQTPKGGRTFSGQ